MKLSFQQIKGWIIRSKRKIAIAAIVCLAVAFLVSLYSYLQPEKWHYYTDGTYAVRQFKKDVKPRFVAWEAARDCRAAFNIPADCADPAISTDGARMVFTRGLDKDNADLFLSRWDGQQWGKPTPLRALNSKFNEIGPSFSHGGEYLYFSTDRPGGQGGYDIWVARWDGAEYAWPLPLTLMVNTPFDELGPSPTPDGKRLYFSSNKPRRELDKNEEELSRRELHAKFAEHDHDLFVADRIPEGVTNSEIERAMSMLYSLREAALSSTNVMRKLSGTKKTEHAIDRALAWLASGQETNGCWSIQKTGGKKGHDVASTAFALLAFYGRSERHDIPCKYRDNVSRGIKWLVRQQNIGTGDLRGKRPAHQAMYDHCIGTLALAEAYGLTKDEDLYGPAQSAIDFLVDAQNVADGGWRYVPKQAGDLSVSGWAIMALKSAELSGLSVPERTFAGIRKWLKKVSGGKHGGDYGYSGAGRGSSAMRATGYFCSQLMGLSPNTPKAFEAAAHLTAKSVSVADVYYAYYGTLASYQNQGPVWRKWMSNMHGAFLAAQQTNGHWIAQGSHAASFGNGIFTSLVTLSLQAHYRYTPLYGLGYEPPEKPTEFSNVRFDEIAETPLYRRAKRLHALSSRADEFQPVVTEHGDFLYFASGRRGGLGGLDIYRTRINGDAPTEPVNLGPAINSPADESSPATRMAGFNLVFSSNRHDRKSNDARLYSAMSRQVFQRHDYSYKPALGWMLDMFRWRILFLVLTLACLVLVLWKGKPKVPRPADSRFLAFCMRHRRALASPILFCVMLGIMGSIIMTLRNTVWCYYTDNRSIREEATSGRARMILWENPYRASAEFNTPSEIHEPAISPDGTEVVFTRGRHSATNADLFTSSWDGHKWSKATPIKGVNLPDSHEISPAFSADGQYLYFASDRTNGIGGFDIYASRRSAAGWTSVTNLGVQCNSAADDLSPDPSSDGRQLYFASDRGRSPGDKSGSFDLYSAMLTLSTNPPASGVKLLQELDSPRDEIHPDITRHSDLFYFVSDRTRGKDNPDIYVSHVMDKQVVGKPENAGASLNTKSDETCPALRWEGFDMLFSSDRDTEDESQFLLYASTTREVFGAVDLSRWYAFKSVVNRMKWWFLLAALALAALYYLLRNWRDMTSLLQKCLVGSVVIHLLLLLITASWIIAKELTESIESKTMEISIDVEALAKEKLALDMQEEVVEMPPSEVNLAVEQVQQDVALPEFTPPKNVTRSDPIVTKSSDQSTVARLTPSKPREREDSASVKELRELPQRDPLSVQPPELETFEVEVTLKEPVQEAPAQPSEQEKEQQTEVAAAEDIQEPIETTPQEYDQPAAASEDAKADTRDVTTTWLTNSLAKARAMREHVTSSAAAESKGGEAAMQGAQDLAAQFAKAFNTPFAAPGKLQVAGTAPRPGQHDGQLAITPGTVQRGVGTKRGTYRQPGTSGATRGSSAGADSVSPGSGEGSGSGGARDTGGKFVVASAGVESKGILPAMRGVGDVATLLVRSFDDGTIFQLDAPGKLAVPETDSPGVTISPKILENPGELSDEVIEGLGGSGETQGAIGRGLDWLSKYQEPDGRWSIAKHGGNKTQHDVSMTSLALLCYYGWGASHNKNGPYRDSVKKAITWLVSKQKANGYAAGTGNMYDHGMAAIALSEGYAVSKDPALRGAASNAVYFIARHQNQQGSWRYNIGQAGIDLSVHGWQFMALASARLAGLDDDKGTLSNAMVRAEACFDKLAHGTDKGNYGYNGARGSSPAMTATGMFCRQLAKTPPTDPRMRASALYLGKHTLTPGRAPDPYYMYYATLALYQHQGRIWHDWNKRMKEVLLGLQKKTGPDSGSWDKGPGHLGGGAGRLGTTVVNILSLEVYYRILPLYGFRDKTRN